MLESLSCFGSHFLWYTLPMSDRGLYLNSFIGGLIIQTFCWWRIVDVMCGTFLAVLVVLHGVVYHHYKDENSLFVVIFALAEYIETD